MDERAVVRELARVVAAWERHVEELEALVGTGAVVEAQAVVLRRCLGDVRGVLAERAVKGARKGAE